MNQFEEPQLLRAQSIVFSSYAWTKLQYFCHRGDVEVGGYGYRSDPSRPFFVTDFLVPDQVCTAMRNDFTEEGELNLTLEMEKVGIQPGQYGQIWIHTHPGSSAAPSGPDREMFESAQFVQWNWTVMVILAKGGETYARLKHNVGPKVEVGLPVEVDWSGWPKALTGDFGRLYQSWETTYNQKVTERVYVPPPPPQVQIAVATNGKIGDYWKSLQREKDDLRRSKGHRLTETDLPFHTSTQSQVEGVDEDDEEDEKASQIADFLQEFCDDVYTTLDDITDPSVEQLLALEAWREQLGGILAGKEESVDPFVLEQVTRVSLNDKKDDDDDD